MTNRNILIVTKAFYPEISPRSFRATELAVEFARSGHGVTVLTLNRGIRYLDFLNSNPNITIQTLAPLKYPQLVESGNYLMRLIIRIMRRTLMLLAEYPDIELMFKISRKLKDMSGFDLMISVAVPHTVHWGVAKARSGPNKIADVWVADCGDPYMGDQADSFRKLFYFKYIEKWAFRRTDYISIPFEGAKNAYYSEFHKKIRIIPQGFRLENLDLPEYNGGNSPPVFAYAGYFIPGKRDPRPFLEYLSQNTNKFQFIVFTGISDLVRPYLKKLKDKLIIREFIPRFDLLRQLATMDFLINFDNNIQTQLPSKLIDYSIVGRPVLNIKGSDDFKIFDEFIRGNYDKKMDLKKPAYYDIKKVAQQFLILYASKLSA